MNSVDQSVIGGTSSQAAGPELPLARLYALRVAYFTLAAGLGAFIWPDVIHHSGETAAKLGIQLSLLAGLGAIAALGLRYPVRMLPLLLFELTWKAIYLLAFALPMWRVHQITPAVASDIKSILMVIIIVPLIPWRFVFAHYIQKQTRPLADGRVTAQNDFARPWFCFSSRVPRHKESQTAPSR